MGQISSCFYAVKDDHIQKCLAQVMPVWTPPCSFASMPKLLESLKVKVIEYSDLRISGADALAERVGEGERLRFMRAVAALQEYFARNDEQLYKSIQVN